MLHGVLIAIIWVSPFLIASPYILISLIALQAFILAHLHFLDNQCILTIIEEYLTGEKLKYYKSRPMTAFNYALSKLFGVNGMLAINTYLPYCVIIADCIKLFLVI